MSLLSQVDQITGVLGAVSELIPDVMRTHMVPRQRVTLLLPFAYLLGSIPFGVVVARMKGKDLMQHGSRNIGATNAGRVLGRKYFWIVFLLDMLKGLLPMLAAGVLMSDQIETPEGLNANQFSMWLVIGFATIIGHMFSAFLKFKGGKGIATSAGVILGLFPYYTLPGIGVFLVWFILFKITRYVSVASIAAAVSFPLFYIGVGIWRQWPITGKQLPLGIFAVVVAALLVYKHRSNIQRLREGTEPHYHPRGHSSHHRDEAEASA